MITTVAFIGFVIFIYFQYSSNIPQFISEIKKEDSRSKAYQISELLLNNPGEPEDWDTSNVRRLGLSDENHNQLNLLSRNKINDFFSICSTDYERTQKLFGLEDTQFSIKFFEINELTGTRTILGECMPAQVEKTEINATLSRVTTFDDGTINLGEIVIEV
jgi:hypothetical protein